MIAWLQEKIIIRLRRPHLLARVRNKIVQRLPGKRRIRQVQKDLTHTLQKNGIVGAGRSVQPRGLHNLKIIVASTPKTGNTWLRHMLAAVYDLPMAALPATFNTSEVDKLGPRWIAQQHYYPESELLEWARENQAVILTTIRHPADTLISLYHYVHNYIKDPRGQGFGDEAAMVSDDEQFGQRTRLFILGPFCGLLNISISWVYSRKSQVVRYEDLWRDPVGTLTRLAEHIHPATRDKIERAVEQSDISIMRRMARNDSKFFRRGTIGGWREELPEEFIDLFRTVEPFPAQFAALGYTLDRDDPLFTDPAEERPLSVSHITHFDNGVPVPTIAVRLYLSFDSAEARARWPNFADTGPGSFYAWLNAPAGPPQSAESAPVITNLGAYMFRIRPDLARSFPDIYGSHRIQFAIWVASRPQSEYNLDPVFTEPMRDGLLRWANALSKRDPWYGQPGPVLTNFAVYKHQSSPDLQRSYPDVFGRDRLDYLIWFIQQPRLIEADFGDFARPIISAWARGCAAEANPPLAPQAPAQPRQPAQPLS